MRVVFIRHGQPRAGEADPELTSAGRRQAREAALWMAGQGWVPSRVVSTPTARTRQTADELQLVFPCAERGEWPDVPEIAGEWDGLVTGHHPGGDAVLAVVGHHPTLGLLLDLAGPAPGPVPRHHHASALCLAGSDRWRIVAAWPGRGA